MSKKVTNVRPFNEEYELKDGRKIYVIAEGRLVNLGSAEGHPSSVMDMSFANQALATEFIFKNNKNLENKVHTLPLELDEKIATLKLKALKITIDKLTPDQRKYMGSWEEGTN